MSVRATLPILTVLLAVTAVAVGCGKKTADENTGATGAASQESTSAAAKAGGTPPAGGAAAANLDYATLDQGPRASATPVDASLAAKGKALFHTKTCDSCHKFDVKLVGPPLGPVPSQRTAKWMMAQMEHPDLMTQNDPTSKQLLADYKVQMVVPGGVTDDEAKALVEYVKSGGK